jgi:microcystin-dependent protein
MAEPFLGEIRLFSLSYAPRGWALCNGQTLSISTNQALFSLLGTVYGGDGITTFKLPDLQGRVPIHVSTTIPQGQAAGETSHTLTVNEMPMHTHQVQASSTPAATADPTNGVWADVSSPYGVPDSLTTMNQASISAAGGSQPHANMQPYLAVNFCIATSGIYPSRN